jgi:hypothetical protein
LDQLASLCTDLEHAINYIKLSPKVSDENEALVAFLAKTERSLMLEHTLVLFSSLNSYRRLELMFKALIIIFV